MSAPPIPSAPADLEFIAQLKSKLHYAELRIRVLEERLRLMRIEKYGPGGEKLSQGQMQLFELEPVVSEMIEQAESEHAAVHRSTKKIVKHPGRLPGKSVELRSTGQPGAAIPTQARSPPAKSKKQETEIELE